ncbi:hypothetical protein [Bradyrhizobium sp. JYMT SZCCT0428]|uniref:hypothetical protein n=1 Tax=Bradyrhizobium sp. JYMT SZCCT0428 TaxID=2807673 RepID=UPI001BA9CFA0|nr:hypothetical protein [Bradyrhizobium sp. JYMT SZCCT0428]MBR1150134.1 hypothetical protein [Bradyrhizobium sp. JYMT SZCCT0428]
MSATIIPFRPVDGPLVEVNRSAIVAEMAKALIEAGSYYCERDAVLTLLGKFKAVDIAMLIDDARQVAMQEAVVALEMSGP